MTEFSQFQFRDNQPSPKSNIYDEREEWEDQLHAVVDDMMPHRKYKRSLIFGIVFGLYFFLTAMIVHLLGNKIVEVVIDYEDICKLGKTCSVKFTIPAEMNPEIQLQIQVNKKPCKELAECIFNDTFTLLDANKKPITIDEESIASSIDQLVYKESGDQSINAQQLQHRMVWMNPSAVQPFRKLWGIIKVTLPLGTYFMNIGNHYNTSALGVKKSAVLINPNSLGYPKPGFIISHYILGSINVAIVAFSTFKLMRFWRDKNIIVQQQ